MVLQRMFFSVSSTRVHITESLTYHNSGDSWRLTIPHVPELQFKLRYLGVKIDFSGIDGWDPTERQRNMEEAELPIV